MKKGQISVVYLGILTVISIFMFAAVFTWGLSLKDSSVAELNQFQAESLLANFENHLASFKTVATESGDGLKNTTLIVQVPFKVGEESYFVRGDNHYLIIDIPGRGTQTRQTLFRKGIYWWNASFNGGAFSGGGRVKFYYNSSSGNITIS